VWRFEKASSVAANASQIATERDVDGHVVELWNMIDWPTAVFSKSR